MPIRRIKPLVAPPRRTLLRPKQTTFKKVDLKRAIDGARMMGLEIGAVDIRPDGTISIRTASAAAAPGESLFDKWQDQL